MVASPTTEQHEDRKRIRLLRLFIRLFGIPILFAIALIAGAVVGYSVVGDGQASDVFKKSTWQHIVNFVKEE